MFGELIAILAVLTFVASNVIFRKTENEASPTFINFFRTGIGTLTFFLLVGFFNSFNLIFMVPWELWLLLILSFVFGQVIGDTAYFSAQKVLGTTISLAISMTFPLFTFIFSLIFLNQRFELNLIISLILIAIGIIIIGNSKKNSEISEYKDDIGSNNSIRTQTHDRFPRTIIKSIGFCFIASLGWAIGAVIIEFTIGKIDFIIQNQELSSIIGNVIRFPFAFLILGVMVLRDQNLGKNDENIVLRKKTKRTWILLIIASILGTSIGAFLYTEGIHLAGANIMSLIASASPLFALPLTYFFNKETISKIGFIGVVFTILGVMIILI